MSDSMDIFLKEFAAGEETDGVMLSLAKALLQMIIVDEPQNDLIVYYEGTSDGMIDITMAFDVGELNIARPLAGAAAAEQPLAGAATAEQPLAGAEQQTEADQTAEATEETAEMNPFMRNQTHNQSKSQTAEELPVPGTVNSNVNPFAEGPETIPIIMPQVEEGETINQAEKTIQERRQEFRAELEAKYGKQFSQIKLANIQKNADRRKYIQFLEESRRIRKAELLLPAARDILVILPPGPDRVDLETAILAVEEEPTDTEIHDLEQLVKRLRQATPLKKSVSQNNQTKIAFRPELIRKATRITQKIEAALKGDLATLNAADRKKLDDNLLLLKTVTSMGDDEEFDKSDEDRLQRIISFFENNYPKIIAEQTTVAPKPKLRRAVFGNILNGMPQPPRKSLQGISNRNIRGNLGPTQTRKQNPLSNVVAAALGEQEEE